MTKDELAIQAIDNAPAVICAVHDIDPCAIKDMLTGLRTEQLYALVIVLAAAFDPNQPLMPALDWLAGWYPAPPSRRTMNDALELRPCGTRTAYIRHIAHGEDPCLDCREANRLYDRLRKQRWRDVHRVVDNVTAPVAITEDMVNH